MKTTWIVLLVVVMLCTSGMAQHSQGGSSGITIDELRATTGFTNQYRMLGDENRGDYWSRTFEVLAESNHRALLNFSLRSNDYAGVDLSGLDATARIAALGFTIPVSSKFSIRGVYNSWAEYATDEITDAGGLYIDWRTSEKVRLEIASEMFFSNAPELYYVTSVFDTPDFPLVRTIYSGVSFRYVQEEGEPHNFEDRFAFGVMIPIGSWQLNGGLSTRIDSLAWSSDTRAWSIGLALPVDYSNRDPWAPSLYMNYREKPGSRYLMVLGSFGGYAFNKHVIAALCRSNHRALNTPARVVHNQAFDIRVLNTHAQEFGRVSYSFVRFAFDVTDNLSSKSSEGSIYYTHTPKATGVLTMPFIGYTHSDEEDITYNFSQHRLESIGHIQHIVEVGARVRLWTGGSSGDNAGKLRLALQTSFGSSGLEGLSFTSTAWF